MESQKKEFNSLDNLIKKYSTLCSVPIVDDEYPEVRHYYEGALRDFISALRGNNRL